ncbi:MAG: response regulator transcription factor [Campylobacterota bacterium]|nr:response regulator transcription factor [Campylobacterota bacterium]
MIQLFSNSSTLNRRFKSIGIEVDHVNDISQLDENEIILTEPISVPALLEHNTNFIIFSLTSAPSFQEGTSLLAMGVKGYGNTYIHAKHLRRAIITIKEGNVWLPPSFMQELIAQATPKSTTTNSTLLDALTKRQKETALLIKKGLSNKEIAKTLNITERTVKAHITAIFEKTEATDRLSLAMLL